MLGRSLGTDRNKQYIVSVCGLVPVIAPMPVFPAGTYWHYKGTTVPFFSLSSFGILLVYWGVAVEKVILLILHIVGWQT